MFYKITGAVFLLLSKIKFLLFGYTSPKPVTIDKCIEYDLKTVNLWLFYLTLYTEEKNYILGKNVIELGPGAGLGAGLSLLSKGALKYSAIDINMMLGGASSGFYEKFLEYLKKNDETVDVEYLREELEKFEKGRGEKLNYICRADFDILSAFGESKIDIVFSFAAFEHFDNIEETVRQLSLVCRHGAVIIAQVDLQTHSRWIREKDPNNVYRYSGAFYNLVDFRGIPNRIRPFQYKDIFSRYGWDNIKIAPLTSLKDNKGRILLNKKFDDSANQMDFLSVMLCARKR